MFISYHNSRSQNIYSDLDIDADEGGDGES